jgi:hypothetical protein
LFPLIVTFTIAKQWKGTRAKEIKVPVAIDAPGGCGNFTFEQGESYLVYVYRKDPRVAPADSNFPERWTPAFCTPNLRANDARPEMKKLDGMANPATR